VKTQENKYDRPGEQTLVNSEPNHRESEFPSGEKPKSRLKNDPRKLKAKKGEPTGWAKKRMKKLSRILFLKPTIVNP